MSTVKITTLSTLDGTYTVPAETLARGACRAWCNFNGTGTVAIRASFNVSSITDNGTGDYTVNFTTAMPDSNYAAPFSGSRTTAPGATAMCNVTDFATTNFKIYITNDLGALTDAQQVSLSIFR